MLDDEGDNSGATQAHSNHYHGRASEPAFSNTRTMGYHGARYVNIAFTRTRTTHVAGDGGRTFKGLVT